MDGFGVAGCQADALDKVENIFEFTVFLPLADKGFNRSLANAFNTAQAEAYFAFLVNGKVQFRFVDVGAFYGDFHCFALLHKLLHVGNGIFALSEVGCHILGGVVGFQITSLIGHPGVAGGVRFVEGV